jgi:hypothetical protein
MTPDGPFFINPDYISPDGRGTTQEGGATFAKQAFYNPGPGTVGNLQRRLFNNPPGFTMDAGIQKVTKIGERHSIELRVDAINVFNHVAFFTGDSYNGGAPASRFNINSTSFGRVGFTYFEPRKLQLGAKYLF